MDELANRVQTFADADALAEAAAAQFADLAHQAMALNGRFTVALSGGSTPAVVYRRLAADPFSGQVDWDNVHVFWSDERCVPPDHPDSNFRMAVETLLAHVPVPGPNVHRIKGEIEPRRAAAEYEAALRIHFAGGGPGHPFFDLVLLGVGEDGHTASLFPDTVAVRDAIAGADEWVVASYIDKLTAWRVTMTPALINASANVVFLVSGRRKANVLSHLLMRNRDLEPLPARLIRPLNGSIVWLVDEDAARELISS